LFKEHQVAKKSQKNSKHVADLLNSATLTSISLLARVDKFTFLVVLDTSTPTLIKEDARNALLIGPWPEPWSLTTKEWVDVVEVLVNASSSQKRPDGHPNSPTCGHLKFPHPERGVTAG
jgi:hypothetical protein